MPENATQSAGADDSTIEHMRRNMSPFGLAVFDAALEKMLDANPALVKLHAAVDVAAENRAAADFARGKELAASQTTKSFCPRCRWYRAKAHTADGAALPWCIECKKVDEAYAVMRAFAAKHPNGINRGDDGGDPDRDSREAWESQQGREARAENGHARRTRGGR